jgi:alkylhydroperoxidase family enzyme
MAFFDIPKDEDIPPEARHWLDELQRLRGINTPPASRLAYVPTSWILKAQVTAEENLFNQSSGRSRFSWEARMMAFMLVAHARRCTGCFSASRRSLIALGFDEPVLDGLCANPTALPLPERDRAFVRYVLRFALSAMDVEPKDFREMATQGLTPDDVREMIGFAAFCMFNTIFTTLANTALRDE